MLGMATVPCIPTLPYWGGERKPIEDAAYPFHLALGWRALSPKTENPSPKAEGSIDRALQAVLSIEYCKTVLTVEGVFRT